jgi:hypothetical protein
MDLKIWLFPVCMDLIDDPELDDPHVILTHRALDFEGGAQELYVTCHSCSGNVPSSMKAVHPIRHSASHRFHTDGKAPSGSERGSIVLRGGSGQRTSVRNVDCCGVLH